MLWRLWIIWNTPFALYVILVLFISQICIPLVINFNKLIHIYDIIKYIFVFRFTLGDNFIIYNSYIGPNCTIFLNGLELWLPMTIYNNQ